MKLPENWGLKERRRKDGKLDLVGKDDSGKEYKARTTEGPEVTARDVEELHHADRETYKDRESGAKEFVRHLVGEPEKPRPLIDQAMTFDDNEWIAAAEPVVHAGFERKGSTIGSTWAYRRGWETIFGGK